MMILRLTDPDDRVRVVDATGMEIAKDGDGYWTVGKNIERDGDGMVDSATNAVVFVEELRFVEILSPNGQWACFDA